MSHSLHGWVSTVIEVRGTDEGHTRFPAEMAKWREAGIELIAPMMSAGAAGSDDAQTSHYVRIEAPAGVALFALQRLDEVIHDCFGERA